MSDHPQPRNADVVAETDPRRWYALGLLCLAFLVVVLGSTIVFAAAPSMAHSLGFAAEHVQWVFTASALTSGGLLFLGGRLADLLGRRRMFVIGVGMFTLSSVLCGIAWSEAILIGARTVQGAATAMLTPAALALVTTTFQPGPERNKALGIWSMIGGVGATGGLLVGGVITDGLGWRWVFFLNLPVGLVILALSPVLLRDSRARDRARGFDLGGAAAITTALVLLVHAITQAPEVGWTSPRTIGLLAASAALVGLFTLIESRSRAPLLPLRILRSRVLIAGNVILFVAGLAVDGMLFILTLYAQQVLDYSAVQFGLALAVMTLTSIAGSYVAQHIVTRTDVRPVAGAGMLLIGVGCLLLTQVSVGGAFHTDLLAALVVFGLGMGAVFVAGSIASFVGVDERDSGVASGLQSTSFTLGTALGVAVMSTTVATARTDSAILAGPDPHGRDAVLTAGYQAAFAAAVAITVAGLIAAVTLAGRNRPNERNLAMTEAKPAASDLVRSYYRAYETSDRALVENLLSADFTFTSPADDRIDRATFFAKCWPFHERLRAFHLRQLSFDTTGVLVRYEAETTDGNGFRNVEHLELDDGHITHIDVYFGALPDPVHTPT